MMDSLSVRAVLKVMEPPMALRVLVDGEDAGEERQGDSFINLESDPKGGVRLMRVHARTHISVTASPTPQNLASSSIPSSRMTVLSTSKHTASALRKSSFVSERVAIVLEP